MTPTQRRTQIIGLLITLVLLLGFVAVLASDHAEAQSTPDRYQLVSMSRVGNGVVYVLKDTGAGTSRHCFAIFSPSSYAAAPLGVVPCH